MLRRSDNPRARIRKRRRRTPGSRPAAHRRRPGRRS